MNHSPASLTGEVATRTALHLTPEMLIHLFDTQHLKYINFDHDGRFLPWQLKPRGYAPSQPSLESVQTFKLQENRHSCAKGSAKRIFFARPPHAILKNTTDLIHRVRKQIVWIQYHNVNEEAVRDVESHPEIASHAFAQLPLPVAVVVVDYQSTGIDAFSKDRNGFCIYRLR